MATTAIGTFNAKDSRVVSMTTRGSSKREESFTPRILRTARISFYANFPSETYRRGQQAVSYRHDTPLNCH